MSGFLCIYLLQIMGHMDVIPFISDGFNIYFPIAILLLCILSFFNVWKKILLKIGFQLFLGNDEMTQELIDEGKELLRRGRITFAGICIIDIELVDFISYFTFWCFFF
jgi:LMBR1-like membrane protein